MGVEEYTVPWLKLPIFIFIWVVIQSFRAVVVILGYFTVPLAVLFRAYEWRDDTDGVGNPRREAYFTWKWMLPWNNFEDGIANDTYRDFKYEWMKIIYWSCIRNPANGLRHTRLALKIDPAKVRWIGGPHSMPGMYDQSPQPEWFLCWHGWRSNLWIQFKMFGSIYRFWIGDAKIFPDDMNGVKDHRALWNAGIPTQFKRLR